MLAAVRQSGCALEHADDALKDDIEVVRQAVTQNGCALKYASSTLQDDLDIILIAARSAGFVVLEQVSPGRLKEPTVIESVFLQNVQRWS